MVARIWQVKIVVAATLLLPKGRALIVPKYHMQQRKTQHCHQFLRARSQRFPLIEAKRRKRDLVRVLQQYVSKKWVVAEKPGTRGERRRQAAWSAIGISIAIFSLLPREAIAVTAKVGGSSLPTPLGLRQVVSAVALVALTGGIGLFRLGLKDLAKHMMVACARCTLQLQLLGGILLQWLLAPTSRQPWWVISAWVVGVGVLGAQEAYGRLEYAYAKLRQHMTMSFLAGGLSVLAIAMQLRLFGTLHPWYQPQTLIPVAGMLFGNCLAAVTLGASSLTRGFVTQKDQVELLLARGATYQEAIAPLVRESITSALTPTITALSVTGIVHIPGMMTGQILAGQPPQQAALYQTIIWFMIASVAAATVQLLAAKITNNLVDKPNHRLQLAGLAPVGDLRATRSGRKGAFSSTALSSSNDNTKRNSPFEKVTAIPLSTLNSLTDDDQRTAAPAILQVRQLLIDRAGVEVSLELRPGDRVGITGASGAGKSQILRTVVGLEAIHGTMNDTSRRAVGDETMELLGKRVSLIPMPEWRTNVCLVANDHPTATGSPLDTYHRVHSLRSNQPHKNQLDLNFTTNEENSRFTTWQLPLDVLQRPWSTLSTGEVQRAHLMIALSLQPKVLLLDEIGSALDDTTTLQVEETLRKCKIPLLLVTHDRDQLDRFCTHHLELESGA